MLVQFFQRVDTFLFYFINVHLANPISDWIMPIITNKYTWAPVWIILVVGLIWKGGVKGRWAVLIAILAVVLADQIVNELMKPYFQRIRPCNVLENINLLGNKKSSKSMPSSHAANFFALATVFSWFYRKYQWYFWFFATLVAYSRVAVGVHYPFDVLVGAICGILFGLTVIFLAKRYPAFVRQVK
ncbi:MAG: phosphatase PAP2 family protein [Calditrichaceae bacterium]